MKMNHTRFLLITLPLAVILAAITLFLSGDILKVYISVMEPLALVGGGLLALRISFIYSKQLRVAFVFFSLFLFIYAAAIILFPLIENIIVDKVYSSLILVVQAIDYVCLILFCINLLRVVRLSGLNKNAWLIIGLTAVICLFLALYSPLVDGVIESSITAITYMIVRLIDAALVVALVPIVWLYISYLKSQQRQSLTFTIIITGIICATMLDYLYEMIVRIFSSNMINESSLYAVIPDALFIFGYLIIMVGLYAHLKDEQWGFDAVDKVMSEGFDIIEDKS